MSAAGESAAARPAVARGFWTIFFRELKWLRRRPFLTLLATLAPAAMFLFFAATYNHQIAADLPIAVLDLDQTTTSRMVARTLDATPDVRVAAHLSDLREGRTGLAAGRYYGVLYTPRYFERDLLAGRRPELTYFYNTQLLSPGNLSARGFANVGPALNAAIQQNMRQARGVSAEAALAAVSPAPAQSHALFNPAQDYTHFLVLALLPTALQLIVTLANAYSIGLDVQTPHRLRALRRLGGGVWPAFFGKIAPLTLVACLVYGLAAALLFGYFGLPLRGSGWTLAGSALAFLLSCQLIGAAAALHSGTTAGALSLLAMIFSPAFGYMGAAFPRLGMNDFAYYVGSIYPGLWHLDVLVDQTIRGAPLDISLRNFSAQLIFILVFGALCAYRLAVLRRRADAAARERGGPAREAAP